MLSFIWLLLSLLPNIPQVRSVFVYIVGHCKNSCFWPILYWSLLPSLLPHFKLGFHLVCSCCKPSVHTHSRQYILKWICAGVSWNKGSQVAHCCTLAKKTMHQLLQNIVRKWYVERMTAIFLSTVNRGGVPLRLVFCVVLTSQYQFLKLAS